MAKILLTGGAGFIGSNIAHSLVDEGKHEVVVIDNLSTGHKENLKPILDRIKFIEGDILDLDLLQKEFAGVDFVLHLAALASVPRSVADPAASNKVNVEGTLNVLIAARDNNVKRVIFSSSSSVYGDSLMLPKIETMRIAPKSPYAAQKAMGEFYMRLFYELYGLETISLRYFNVFGPMQDPKSDYAAVFPAFISKILKGEQPIIFGDGQQSRDFSYVDNITKANMLACDAAKTKGQIVNIGNGGQVTVLELAQNIGEIVGKEVDPIFEEARAGDVLHTKADITKAQQLLGYEPAVDFDEGLKKTIEWFKQNLN